LQTVPLNQGNNQGAEICPFFLGKIFMAKISESWHQDGNKIVHVKTHDWNPMLDQAQAYRDQGIDGFGENKLVGVIDPALLGEWLKEAGVAWDDTHARAEVVKRKMLSGDFDKLRVWDKTY
jgi:hypothetical protein